LEIECRAADNFEYVGGRCLLLQRIAQFFEQPRVLDGDDGLGGEVSEQLNLPVGERANLGSVDANAAYRHLLLKHWSGHQGTQADLIDTEDQHRIAVAIALSSRTSRIWMTCPVRIARAVAVCGPGLRTLCMYSARAGGTPSVAPT
jgi:hypothetical protein